ncbi:MAG: hypothetical protein K8R25_00120 [Methanosarcinales archaeon]|nr:hypothetical protein [Methanosarcinales archaeon]
MRQKTATMGHNKTIIYNKEQWEMLINFRKKASRVMYALKDAGLDCFIYGSVARGDVSATSDMDIVIPHVMQSFIVELALDNIGITGRKLVQATPGSLIKAHIYLPDNTMVTFPLVQPVMRDVDFYAFGGKLGPDKLEDIEHNRVPGVNKQLMVIEPNPGGHIETPVSDISPGALAKKLGTGQDIINERIRVLSRRARVGITGVYLDRMLAPDEGFEVVLDGIAAEDSLVRRIVRKNR